MKIIGLPQLKNGHWGNMHNRAQFIQSVEEGRVIQLLLSHSQHPSDAILRAKSTLLLVQRIQQLLNESFVVNGSVPNWATQR